MSFDIEPEFHLKDRRGASATSLHVSQNTSVADLPSHQSPYRAHNSTEIAITAVHDELAHNIDSGKVSVFALLDLST